MIGSPVMIASCSRLAWAHNRDEVVAALNGTLGAMHASGSGLGGSSDAYAVVAVRGADAPLAEARLPCCATPPCASCAQARSSQYVVVVAVVVAVAAPEPRY